MPIDTILRTHLARDVAKEVKFQIMNSNHRIDGNRRVLTRDRADVDHRFDTAGFAGLIDETEIRMSRIIHALWNSNVDRDLVRKIWAEVCAWNWSERRVVYLRPQLTEYDRSYSLQ